MEAIRKELDALFKCASSRTKSISRKKMQKKEKQQILVEVIEDSLSEIYCTYALDLAESLILAKPSDPEIHSNITGTLLLLEKTKKEIGDYVSMHRKDPISEEYLAKALNILGYAVVDK